MEYIHRELEATIHSMCSQFKVILVTGPRQVGKTTMLKECLKDSYHYVTLDDMDDLLMIKSAPAQFFKMHAPPVVIDEIQYAQDAFRFIKLMVDQQDKKGLVCLTGSQTYLLMKNVSESLAGRIGIVDMSGLSLRELHTIDFPHPFLPTPEYAELRRKTLKSYGDVWPTIFRGCMPELADEQHDWNLFYRSYVKSYIQRDVCQAGFRASACRLPPHRPCGFLHGGQQDREFDIIPVSNFPRPCGYFIISSGSMALKADVPVGVGTDGMA